MVNLLAHQQLKGHSVEYYVCGRFVCLFVCRHKTRINSSWFQRSNLKNINMTVQLFILFAHVLHALEEQCSVAATEKTVSPNLAFGLHSQPLNR